MKDLKQLWQEERNGAEMLEQILVSESYKKPADKSPLAKLKTNLAIHIGYALIITVAYALVVFHFPYWQIQGCILLLIVFNLWAIKKAYELYKNIDPNLWEHNVLQELKSHHHAFTEWEKQSLRVTLFVYPFAIAGGFMLGGTIGMGNTLEAFLAKDMVVPMLLITTILFIPVGYLLTKWFTKIAFGIYVEQLKARIDELENEGL